MTSRSLLFRFEDERVDVESYFWGRGLFYNDFSIGLDCTASKGKMNVEFQSFFFVGWDLRPR
jgi:hypothetical protein